MLIVISGIQLNFLRFEFLGYLDQLLSFSLKKVFTLYKMEENMQLSKGEICVANFTAFVVTLTQNH